MKIHSTPHRALTVTGGALLAAGLFASRLAIAQDAAPAATPVPAAAPVPAAETFPATPPVKPAAPAPPSTAPVPAAGNEPWTPPTAYAPFHKPEPQPNPAAPTPPPTLPRTPAEQFKRSFRALVTPAPRAGAFRAAVGDAVVNEETQANPEEAARRYQALIAEFDAQRGDAAQAVFRLGESYRKLGRMEEARVQYARVLREFVDFPELTALSLRQLGQIPPAQGGGVPSYQGADPRRAPFGYEAPPTQESARVERELLEEELQLLRRQRDETVSRIVSGVEPNSAAYAIDREILQVRRQLMRLTPPPADQPSPEAPGKNNTPVLQGDHHGHGDGHGDDANAVPGARQAPVLER